MFRLHRRRKRYININLTTKRRESFLQKIGVSLLAQLKGKNLYLELLSFLGFISIFVTNSLLNSYIERLKNEINKLDYRIRLKSVALNRLKQNLKKADKIFKKLYIPELKEKAFILWYNDKFEKNIWKNVKAYAEIVGNIPSFVGFSVYPNPYVNFDKKFLIPNTQKHEIVYKRFDRNYFLQPYNFSNSLVCCFTLSANICSCFSNTIFSSTSFVTSYLIAIYSSIFPFSSNIGVIVVFT